ncbi:MAG: RHS repeat protein [Lachnospiraceae bacterium]|nr:RHS repeat protein [Lachnospiraceae bacterium]
MGNKIKELNKESGSVTTYSYVGGSLISAATDALSGKTSATYDVMGNLVSFTNPNGGVTTYTYDQNQNVTSETVGDYYHVECTYNQVVQVKTTKNSRGQVASYEYDKAGRVTKQADEAGIITYAYDANGNVLAVSETPEKGESESKTGE